MLKTIGHQKVIDLLQKQISKKNFSHSYLFLGEKNLGKRIIALEFARTILDKNLRIEEMNKYPDFLEIDKEENKKNIGINQIRNLKIFFSSKPFVKNYKIALINQSHLLTIEAQNSLLKILEETPLNGIIILLSEKKDVLLPTIISRCQTIQFFPVKKVQIRNELQNETNWKHLLLAVQEEILEQAQGKPGLVFQFLKKPEILERNKKIAKEFLEVFQKPLWQRFEYIEKKTKKEKEEILEEIDLWLLFLSRTLFLRKREKLNLSLEKVLNLIEKGLELKRNLKEEVNLKLALENFVF